MLQYPLQNLEGFRMNMLLKKVVVGAALASSLLMGANTARADLLADIKAKGEIVIGTEARFTPFEFMENGKIVGYSSDLLEVIMRRSEQLVSTTYKPVEVYLAAAIIYLALCLIISRLGERLKGKH